MDKKTQIDILMSDYCTRKEAEKHLKDGTTIFENPEDYIQALKDNDCYEGETIESIRENPTDVKLIDYHGYEYLIMYVL